MKKLSLQQLMDVEVTTVSKRPEKLSETASAIQVITSEDIRRSGATTLPEALRLAPNLHVAQVNARDWAITARGFNGAPLANNSLGDKLLVMIDGRSVYTPLFGGVYWDVQNVPLGDIDRIEVVSGPGGTLWGANAVNGVVNIVTKSAKETQGAAAAATVGTDLHNFEARYGGSLGADLSYRAYAEQLDHDSTELESGGDARDGRKLTQGGFRMDYQPSESRTVTVQGDYYDGKENVPADTYVNGQNILARWTEAFSKRSDLSVQVYFDRTWRTVPSIHFSDTLQTFDVDFEHRFPLGTRQSILWGADYRLMNDVVANSQPLAFLPARRNMPLFSAFAQDEISLARDHVKITAGTKFEQNDFSGLEIQPNLRASWIPSGRQMTWAAVSRSVRAPSRFDSDSVTPSIGGDPAFDAESVISYEIGYRVRPQENLSLSLAAFHNDYHDLRSVDYNLKPGPPLIFANDQRGDGTGIELSGSYQATEWWRLRGGYTYLSEKLHSVNPLVYPGSDVFEADDPKQQSLLQSTMNLPSNVQLDAVGRYVDSLPATPVTSPIPGYVTFDTRLAWKYESWEFSLVGQNLADGEHTEFGSPRSSHDVSRRVYGKVSMRW